MLSKLLKYEFQATARLFLPLYLALTVFALINRFIKPFQTVVESSSFNIQALLSLLSITAYIALIVGIVAMTLIIMILRFYKNLLGDEGYLMFTLPVHTWKHIVSKLVAAMTWSIASIIVTVGSVLIISGATDLQEPLAEMAHAVTITFGAAGFFTLPGYGLIALAGGILMIYAALALGHLFAKYKLLASFGMYCAFYIVNQVIMFFYILLLGGVFSQTLRDITDFTPLYANGAALAFALPWIVLTAGYFFLTNIVLKKKLNLE